MEKETAEEKVTSAVNSVVRSLEILEYLTYSPSSVGISDLSRRLGINRTTVYNLISSLIQKGYVGKDDHGKYHVTSRLFELGTVYQNSFPLVHLVKRSIFPVQGKVKCSCKLTVLADNLRAVIIFSRCNEDELFQLPLGYSFPLHTSASGKVLLAYSPKKFRDKFFSAGEFSYFTENTITDPTVFREELKKVRENGYAVDNCEYEQNQICYAAPVINNTGVLAAISVSGSKKDMLEHREQLLPEVIAYTRNLSMESGYIPCPPAGTHF